MRLIERLRRATVTGGPDPRQLSRDLDELTACAEAIAARNGIRVTVLPASYSVGGVRQQGFYTVRTSHTTSGPHSFRDAWSYLHGIEAGAHAQYWTLR
ncbi:hypothetical protein [Mycolicibacterium goodii]|uniref:hypothetical protein n=1 Tax=Mycolicibacterium goodii TaxID=134601 RepID=UPI001BDD6195|nr:hypothetical protein [Mycolicibacterium goodii]MBU8830806.1 hypothetical protein [Mycolicibacterium goodii]